MNCALVFLPVWKPLTPPLQLASLKASLLAHGIDCRARDYTVDGAPSHNASWLDDAALAAELMSQRDLLVSWTEQILSDAPDVVGFSVVKSNLAVTRAVARLLREHNPEVTIVSGGPVFVRVDAVGAALEYSDFVVQGEGERVLPELVRRSRRGGAGDLGGVWVKGEDGRPFCRAAPELPNLDGNPPADFDDFDFDRYVCKRRLPVMFSRGCVLRCSFCDNSLAYKTQRTRSGEHVFSELRRNAKRHAIKEYTFNDDSLISRVTLSELERFVDLALAEGLVYPWSIYGTRVEKLVTEGLVKKLRKSGLCELAVGVESFSTEVQQAMGKSSTRELADRFVRMFAEEGVAVNLWIIYGYPTETDDQFEETLQWLRDNGHLVRSVWGSVFHATDCYRANRPNEVACYGSQAWSWRSERSTLEKRKERFSRLMEVVGGIAQRGQGGPDFSIVDPCRVRGFRTWSPADKQEVEQRWAELAGAEPAR